MMDSTQQWLMRSLIVLVWVMIVVIVVSFVVRILS